jgi:alkanesulfonate monooxygenase SsuD/methylene tetrahydromethanopterin reductase-like flavin-dependent oxidoreductase (luciferase family)
MIGALHNRPRLLRLVAQYADIWNAWLPWQENGPTAIPPLREAVDAACIASGRSPASLARSVSVQIDYPGAENNREPGARPLSGDAALLAEALTGFAREGIGHVQIVLNPNTLGSIERFVEVLEVLDRGSTASPTQTLTPSPSPVEPGEGSADVGRGFQDGVSVSPGSRRRW